MSNSLSIYNEGCSLTGNLECPETGAHVLSKSGLDFSVSCTNYPYYDLLTNPYNLRTVGECIELCTSQLYSSQGCTAFVYGGDCQCYLKTNESVTYLPTPSNNTIGGFANIDQFLLPENTQICSHPNLSIQNATNGAPYKVFCGTDFVSSDYAPQYISQAPNYTTVSISPPNAVTITDISWHTESWQGCLELCATAHPACWRFTFNPSQGWLNCFLKNDTAQYPSGLTNAPVSSGGFFPPTDSIDQNWKCRTGSQQTVSGVGFTLSCNDFRLPTSGWQGVIDQKYYSNIGDCMAACVSMRGDGLDCVAVMFDNKLAFGWDNCYFKSEIGLGQAQQNYTLAYLTSKAADYTTPVGTIPKSSSEKLVAITVPAIVGTLVILLLLYFVFRRFRYRFPHVSQYRGFHPVSTSHNDHPATEAIVRRVTAYEGANMELQSLHPRH